MDGPLQYKRINVAFTQQFQTQGRLSPIKAYVRPASFIVKQLKRALKKSFSFVKLSVC